jgi:hypothetical protein
MDRYMRPSRLLKAQHCEASWVLSDIRLIVWKMIWDLMVILIIYGRDILACFNEYTWRRWRSRRVTGYVQQGWVVDRIDRSPCPVDKPWLTYLGFWSTLRGITNISQTVSLDARSWKTWSIISTSDLPCVPSLANCIITDSSMSKDQFNEQSKGEYTGEPCHLDV